MKNDDLGERMKEYEGQESDRRFTKLLPIVARLDGRAFHTFTKGMERPYDKRFMNLMIETTKYLVQETNACVGYTQSDEISLAWHSSSYKSQIFFDGRIMKMTSILAAMATLYFNKHLPDHFSPDSGYLNKEPMFDCRVWYLPNVEEATNVFLWREEDAMANSLLMLAQHYHSHKEMFNKSSHELHDMVFKKGDNWNNYPPSFKRGTYIQRVEVKEKLSEEDLKSLPEKHNARTNPDLEFTRTKYQVLDLPPLIKISNRCEVLFQGAKPMPMEGVN